MPPEGYETVTLPNELVADIDGIVGYDSRAKAIRALLSAADMPHEHEWPGDGMGETLDTVESSLQEIEKRTGRMEQTLEELAEGRR